MHSFTTVGPFRSIAFTTEYCHAFFHYNSLLVLPGRPILLIYFKPVSIYFFRIFLFKYLCTEAKVARAPSLPANVTPSTSARRQTVGAVLMERKQRN